jgi:hypothetical protein
MMFGRIMIAIHYRKELWISINHSRNLMVRTNSQVKLLTYHRKSDLIREYQSNHLHLIGISLNLNSKMPKFNRSDQILTQLILLLMIFQAVR